MTAGHYNLGFNREGSLSPGVNNGPYQLPTTTGFRVRRGQFGGGFSHKNKDNAGSGGSDNTARTCFLGASIFDSSRCGISILTIKRIRFYESEKTIC